MSQVIVYQSNYGMVVVNPAPDVDIQFVLNKDVPPNTITKIMDANDLPPDVDFRYAWEFNTNDLTIRINFTKAIEVTKERLRVERAPLLADLDVQFQRALEVGADTTAIVAEKQRLRDITNLADSAQSLDELRAIRVTA